jgi:hypothetical protein
MNISLKAKHFYYISYYLKNSSLEKFFSLFDRIKTALVNNTDLEAEFTIDASIDEILTIYKTLTILPEGQSNVINTEMATMLGIQIQAGAAIEIANGLVVDIDGNIPQGAYWQSLGIVINGIRAENITFRDNAIEEGKKLVDL